MKKYLPFILLGVGLLVVIGAFVLVKSKKTAAPTDTDTESALLDVPLGKRPVVALTPDAEGHYLKLHIEKIQIEGAKTLDYELVYQVPEHPSQGVPGSIDVSDKTSFDADLLLGSESSGKFRYDEEVESGTITLRFRNEAGKLLTKFSTDFHMQKDPETITSQDGKLSIKLDKAQKGFFITMPSIGVPKELSLPKELSPEPKAGPYVVHSSLGDEFSAKVSIAGAAVYHFEDGEWKGVSDVKNLGYFVAAY
jgi:hypothetical protein